MSTKQILYTLGILVVLGAAFAFWASFTKPVGPTTGQPQDSLGGTLTAEGDFVYTEDKPYYSIEARYPANTGLQAAADAKARATIEKGIADQIATFKADAGLDTLTAQDAQIQNISDDHKYALAMEYKTYSSTTTISYAYQVYADTLGAHPNLYYKTFVFDQEGNRLALADLFAATSTGPGSDYLNQISGAASVQVADELTRRLGAEPGESFFDEGVAPNPDNFTNFVIDNGDLVFLIPPYQVAAYAAGSFEVRIPLSQFSRILKI